MKISKQTLLSVVLSIIGFQISSNAYAGINFQGSLVEVISPNILLVRDSNGGEIKISIRGPLFSNLANRPCNNTYDGVDIACKKMTKRLKGRVLDVVFESYEGKLLYGDIVYDDKVLSEQLVLDGEYRVDAHHSRAQYLLLAEKEALCKFRGIWEKYKGQHEYASICQAR